MNISHALNIDLIITQAVIHALIRTHPDPAALRAALVERFATVQLGTLLYDQETKDHATHAMRSFLSQFPK